MDRFGSDRNMGYRKLPLPRDHSWEQQYPAVDAFLGAQRRSWNPAYDGPPSVVYHSDGKPRKFDEFFPTRGKYATTLPRDGGYVDHGKYDNLSDVSDDVVCGDVACYRKGSKPKLENTHVVYNQDEERTKLAGVQVDRLSWKPTHYNHLRKIKIPAVAESCVRRELSEDSGDGDDPRLWSVVHRPQYETINSGETRGEYVQQTYAETIDAATPAWKYGGVIVTNW